MSAQYAVVEHRCVAMSTDFSQTLVAEKFGPEVLARLPLYSRGPRKGLPKGYLCWRKCTVGGWSRMRQCVVYPGTSEWCVRLAVDYMDPENQTVLATWERGSGTTIVADAARSS